MKSILHPGSETRLQEGCGETKPLVFLIKNERSGISRGKSSKNMNMFAIGGKVCGFLQRWFFFFVWRDRFSQIRNEKYFSAVLRNNNAAKTFVDDKSYYLFI